MEHRTLSLRLKRYFGEAEKHVQMMEEALDVIRPILPIGEYETLTQLERFALNTLIFRFSKLQDLIGAKIFRSYLEYNEYETSDMSFYDLLREIEKEGIVDIDTWSEFRQLRNRVAHEYPEELDEMIESLNLFVAKSTELIQVYRTLEGKVDALERT